MTRTTTSDGIPTKAWDRIHELSLHYANSVTAGQTATAEKTRRAMLRALNSLEARFGKRPSILATKGEYVKPTSRRRDLLLDAFDAARRRGDKKNITLIASSLAEFFADEVQDTEQARKWAHHLEKALVEHFDQTEAQVLKSLKRRFR
jgi:hypothetical protein